MGSTGRSIAAMIIVSGRIHVAAEQRDEFVAASLEAVAQARRAEGCRDFVVAARPARAGRVNVYEEWESEAALLAFRGDGPGEELGAQILDAQVRRHEVAASGPA